MAGGACEGGCCYGGGWRGRAGRMGIETGQAIRVTGGGSAVGRKRARGRAVRAGVPEADSLKCDEASQRRGEGSGPRRPNFIFAVCFILTYIMNYL